MIKKKMLLAMAMSALALAIPSAAAAGTPEVHCNGAACGLFTVTSVGTNQWSNTNGFTTTCTGMTGTGSYTSKTGGTISLKFHGCVETITGLNTPCTTLGQPSGTVTLGTAEFENIYLTDAKTKPGILIKNINATYTCFATHTTLSGNLIGELESGCSGGTRTSLPLTFQKSASGHQTYMQKTGTGTLFDLQNKYNATTLTTALEGTGQITTSGGHPVLTCV